MSDTLLSPEKFYKNFDPAPNIFEANSQFNDRIDYFDIDLTESSWTKYFQAWLQADFEFANNNFLSNPSSIDMSMLEQGYSVVEYRANLGSLIYRAQKLPCFIPLDIAKNYPNLASLGSIDTLGYEVSLPINLSQRQKDWLALINPPVFNGGLRPTFLFTVHEYEFLKKLRVITPAHQANPIQAFALPSFLTTKIETVLDNELKNVYMTDVQSLKQAQSIYLYCIAPNSPILEDLDTIRYHPSYKVLTSLYQRFIARNERLHQLASLTNAFIATNTKTYQSNPELIHCDWIEVNRGLDDNPTLLLNKLFDSTGWYRCLHKNSNLSLVFVMISICGLIPVKILDDSNEYLQLLFEIYQQILVINDELNHEGFNRVKQAFDYPKNYLAFKNDLMEFHDTLIVLFSLCQYNLLSHQDLSATLENFLSKFE